MKRSDFFEIVKNVNLMIDKVLSYIWIKRMYLSYKKLNFFKRECIILYFVKINFVFYVNF